MDSKFLPTDYNREPITLIAGRGRYPALLTEIIRAKGIPLKLISIKSETDDSLIDGFSRRPRFTSPWKGKSITQNFKIIRKQICDHGWSN